MQTPKTRASGRTNRMILATLTLSMLLASLSTSIANIALPALAQAFSSPFHDVQWVVIAYLGALTLSVLLAGRLGDRYGLRRMLIAGLCLFAVAALLAGIAPNLPFLVGARALQGLGAAFLMTLTMALVRETAGERNLGRVMGLFGTFSALGTALGPSLGGILLTATGWQGIFLVQVPLAVLALILVLVTLPPDMARTAPKGGGSRTMLPPGIVPNLVVNLCVAAVMMTTLVVGPFYLGLGLGLSEIAVGIVMSVGPLISILGGILAGRAVDAWGSRRILFVGLSMLTAGTLLLALLPQALGVAGYVIAIAILTPGYQLFQAANNTAVMADVPRDNRGNISGLLNLSRNIGLVAGASAMASVFSLAVGTGDLATAAPASIAGGMATTFLLATAMMAAALLLASRFSR